MNDDINEKENGYANDTFDEKENAYVNNKVNEVVNEKEKNNVKETVNEKNSFIDSLILDDFDDEEEYSSFGIGSMSNYIEGKLLEEQETMYRQSQGLEEERELYI